MASTTFSGAVTSTNGFVGALTGNVTGDVTGTLTGNQLIPTATKAAAGSAQGDATALSLGFNLVTGADATKGVVLPTAVAGQIVIVRNNDGTSDLKIYPASSDKINGGSANAAITIQENTSLMLIAYDATDWYSLPVTAS